MSKNRYSNKLKEVLKIAEKEARLRKQSEVGSEYFLLAIYKLSDSMMCKFLETYGLTEEIVSKHVDKFSKFSEAGDKKRKPIDDNVPLPYSKKLQDSLDEAVIRTEKYGHSGVGTPHVVLVMLEDGGTANFILGVEGISANDLKAQIINYLGDSKSTNTNSLNKGNNTLGRSDRYKFRTPLLDSVSRDLTKVAEEGKLDPMIGRDKELRRAIEILSRRTKNNPILLGEPGVGKSALVEGLALAIVNGEVPKKIEGLRLVQLDLTHLVAGTKYRGEFEEKVKKLIDEVKKAENVVLFIDEIHSMIGAGGAEGALDVSNILKPALSRGEIKCIGATTLDEYKKYFEKDSALERRFQPIQLNEPTEEQAIQILHGLKSKYEEFHQVIITDEAIESAVVLSSRYIMDRQLPDKAIDLIDEASVKVALGNLNTNDSEVISLVNEIENLRKEKQRLLKSSKFTEAAEVRKKEMTKIEELKGLNGEVAKTQSLNLTESDEDTNESLDILGKVEESHVSEVVANWTGVPVTRLSESESERLLKLGDKLHERVVGQAEAVTTLSKAVKRSRAGLQDPTKPIGSFLFLGPTGVGKTELAKTLAVELFGDEKSLIRLDMSEYMEKHSVSRLVGSPPGYVGYDEGGQLTEKVRRKPYSVVLLDEIEKAHPDVFNILLQILDDGQLTDSKGRLVNFKNTIIIMTSNLGVSELRYGKSVGFGSEDSNTKNKRDKDIILAKLKDTLKPEFINRIDSTIVFHSLEKEHLLKIVDILVEGMLKRFKDNKYNVDIDKSVYEKVLKEGTDVEYGARPLKRALQSVVEDFLSEKILEGNLLSDTKYKLVYEEDKDVLKLKKVAVRKPKEVLV